MKAWSHFAKIVLVSVVVGICAFVPAPGARAQPAIDPDAKSVLVAMSSYLGGLKSFSVEYVAVDEIVTRDGQKLQFLHSGKVIAQRPNMLFATRGGSAGVAELFLDTHGLTLYAKNANAYLHFDAASIDSAVDTIHNFGFDAPGADLLVSKPLDSSTTDMTSGVDLGLSYINGVEVNQLAFRGTDVDWQLWVAAGDKPLPLRYVVTTKGMNGAPQFTLELRNWDVAPKIDAAQFTFTPPQGARKLDPTKVTVNAIGDVTIKGE